MYYRQQGRESFAYYGGVFMEEWNKIFFSSKKRIFSFFSLLAVFPILALVYVYASSPVPTVTLQFPKESQEVTGEKIFIKGRVVPSGSRVTVNKEPVAGNGDGSFTAVVAVPEGKSTLSVEASYRGKKAKVLHLISRVLSEQEQQAQLEKNKKEDLAVAQKVLGEDEKIDQLLSAYNTGSSLSAVHILSHALKKAGSFQWVAGEVINGLLEDAHWVKIAATFYDTNNNPVDTQVGFAVAEEQVLKPGEIVKFKTKSTLKAFSFYKLNVEWKTSEVISDTQENKKKQ